jgi:hypothetical protein
VKVNASEGLEIFACGFFQLVRQYDGGAIWHVERPKASSGMRDATEPQFVFFARLHQCEIDKNLADQ